MIITTPVKGNHPIEVQSFGKSMYGGWYLDFYDPIYQKYDGIRRATLREICAWLGVSRTALTRDVKRWDN